MKYLNIAIRNLNREKKRSLLLGGAIAFGILVITLVNTFTAGITRNIKEGFVQFLGGHIYVSQEIKRDDDIVISNVTDDTPVFEVIESLGVEIESLSQRSSMSANIIFNGREALQQVNGVIWEEETALRDRINLKEGNYDDAVNDPRGIILTEDAANRLNVQVGEEVVVRTRTVTEQENVGNFVVRGIMVDSTFLGSIFSYASLDRVNEIINLPAGSYQDLRITLPRLEETDQTTEAIYASLGARTQVAPRDENAGAGGGGGFASNTFQDEEEEEWSGTRYQITNINDFTTTIDQIALTLNAVGLSILIILIVITMVGVINTFRMVMFERVKEVGTMRAVGVQRGGIRSIFLWEAFGLGTLGYIIGIILSFIAIALFQFVTIPSDNAFNIFTLNGKLTFPLSFASIIANYILMLGFTVLSANIPASRAAKLPPADALRA